MTFEEMKRRWLARTGPLSTGISPVPVGTTPSFADIMGMPVSEEAWQTIPPSDEYREITAYSANARDKRVLEYLKKRKEELARQARLKEKLAQQRMPFNVAEGIERIPPNLIGGRYGVPSDVDEGMEEGYLKGRYGVASDKTLGMEEYIPTVPAVTSDIKDDVIEETPSFSSSWLEDERKRREIERAEEFVSTTPFVERPREETTLSPIYRTDLYIEERPDTAVAFAGSPMPRQDERPDITIEKQAAAIEAAAESGPTPFEDRLNRTLANYGNLADSLPIPSGNPLILKQREGLQSKADLWARLRNQNPTPIVFKDRMTAAQTKAAYEQQKDQFLGDVFAMAMPSNIEETNALARAIGADKSSWIDLHNILRKTRKDYAYQNQELTFKKAKDQDNVGMVLPSILQELQRDNGGRTPTRTQILNRLVEYSDTYNWPRLASTESVSAATTMYTDLYPDTPSTTWYSRDGFDSMDVFNNDTVQQKILRDKKWTTEKPGTPAMGQVSTALPQNADVPEDVRKAFIAAKKHFGIRKSYKPGYVFPVTINTKKDKTMWNALVAGGARAYDPNQRGLVTATYFGRNKQAISTFDNNNEVARAHYEAAKLRNPGAAIEVITGELAAEKYRQSELNDARWADYYERQVKANDLYNMADKMQKWFSEDQDAFGFVGEFNKWIQTAMQVGSDIYNSLAGAGILSQEEFAAQRQATTLLEDLYEFRSMIQNDLDESRNKIPASITNNFEYAETKASQIEQIDQLIADTAAAKNGSLWSKETKYSKEHGLQKRRKWDALNRIRTNPRLAQIQLYELGMAAQLARMWVTKDRLLKDIYLRATEATRLRGWQGRGQVAAKLSEIKVLAASRAQELEKLMSPQLEPTRQKVGEFGGIRDIEGSEEAFGEEPIPSTGGDLTEIQKKRLEAEFRETYGQ
jgi:hypothetical protein